MKIKQTSFWNKMHVTFLNLTLVEWLCLIFVILAVTVER